MAVDLKEALAILESGQWCHIRLITADVIKGTGGKVVELSKARITRHKIPTGSTISEKQNNSKKAANHHLNFTKNVELPNKQVRKLHPLLITHINHIQVV